MTKKKLTIFTLSMGSGGAEKVISLLLPLLVKEYEVTLFLFFNKVYYQIPANVKIVFCSENENLTSIQRLLLLPKIIHKYKTLLKRTRPAVSLSFLPQPNIINGYLASYFPDTKFVLSERAYPSIEYRSSNLRFLIYKFLLPKYYNKAQLVFSNSSEINCDLQDNFQIKNELKVLYNPVKTFEKKLYLLKNHLPFKVISVGRLIPVKNHQMIAKAILKSSFRETIKLKVLGEGLLRNDLEQYQSKINFDLPGNSNNVNEHLMDADVFVLSSLSEGFPNALLEAMAAGLPVISTNCKSGPLELLNENEKIIIPKGGFIEAKYGIMVNTDDENGMCNALEFLYENPEKRVYYSEQSFNRSQDFGLDTIYQQLKEEILEYKGTRTKQ